MIDFLDELKVDQMKRKYKQSTASEFFAEFKRQMNHNLDHCSDILPLLETYVLFLLINALKAICLFIK